MLLASPDHLTGYQFFLRLEREIACARKSHMITAARLCRSEQDDRTAHRRLDLFSGRMWVNIMLLLKPNLVAMGVVLE